MRKKIDTDLKIGVAAPAEVFVDDEFILLCDLLEAEILVLPDADTPLEFLPRLYASAADFIIETRTQLSLDVSGKLLDRVLVRSLANSNIHRRGVIFEVLIGLLLSQVRGFEVHAVGISNRSQQMDVIAQNRNAGGVLSGSPIILAEAKNWKDPVTPTEYAEFVRKMQSRHGRAKLGFLMTTSRFTEGVELERRRESKEDYLVVLVNHTDLVGIWRSGNSITERVENLVISATVGS